MHGQRAGSATCTIAWAITAAVPLGCHGQGRYGVETAPLRALGVRGRYADTVVAQVDGLCQATTTANGVTRVPVIRLVTPDVCLSLIQPCEVVAPPVAAGVMHGPRGVEVVEEIPVAPVLVDQELVPAGVDRRLRAVEARVAVAVPVVELGQRDGRVRTDRRNRWGYRGRRSHRSRRNSVVHLRELRDGSRVSTERRHHVRLGHVDDGCCERLQLVSSRDRVDGVDGNVRLVQLRGPVGSGRQIGRLRGQGDLSRPTETVDLGLSPGGRHSRDVPTVVGQHGDAGSRL